MSKSKPGCTGYRGQAPWQIAAQYIGFAIIVFTALCLDGLMDACGPLECLLWSCVALGIAAGLIWAGNVRLRK